MHIAKVTFRNRNDFHFVAFCRHCRQTSRWGDGYADAYYQTQVFPARHCPHCGVNELGEKRAGAERRLSGAHVADGLGEVFTMDEFNQSIKQ